MVAILKCQHQTQERHATIWTENHKAVYAQSGACSFITLFSVHRLFVGNRGAVRSQPDTTNMFVDVD